jgi:uncharacterized protein (TIGR03086 family)
MAQIETHKVDDVPDLYRRAMDSFAAGVARITDGQWDLPTPCADWSVRDLVGHVTGENLWATPLMAGETVEQVGDRFEGDLLGDDPRAAFDASAAEALEAVGSQGAMDRTVHLSFGDCPGREYAMQLLADLVIHGWDLARATDIDERIDPDLVTSVSAWFATMAEVYRETGAIGPPPPVPEDADDQTRLLAEFGRIAY